MESIPENLHYTSSHEWVRQEEDNIVTVGITEHAQHLLGDIVFVEFPDLETEIASSDEVGVIESVKAASDLYAPLSGKIVAVNEDLTEAPVLVNQDPYGDGWLIKIELSDPSELKELLDSVGYAEQIAEEE